MEYIKERKINIEQHHVQEKSKRAQRIMLDEKKRTKKMEQKKVELMRENKLKQQKALEKRQAIAELHKNALFTNRMKQEEREKNVTDLLKRQRAQRRQELMKKKEERARQREKRASAARDINIARIHHAEVIKEKLRRQDMYLKKMKEQKKASEAVFKEYNKLRMATVNTGKEERNRVYDFKRLMLIDKVVRKEVRSNIFQEEKMNRSRYREEVLKGIRISKHEIGTKMHKVRETNKVYFFRQFRFFDCSLYDESLQSTLFSSLNNVLLIF